MECSTKERKECFHVTVPISNQKVPPASTLHPTLFTPWCTLFLTQPAHSTPHYLSSTLPLDEMGGTLRLRLDETDGGSEPFELFEAQGFGEDVGCHVVGWAVLKIDDSFLDEFSTVFVCNVDVFCPF